MKPQSKAPSIWAMSMDDRAAHKRKQPLRPEDEEPVAGKVVIITGANAGLGAAAALEFAKRGAVLGLCCRDVEKAKKVIEGIRTKVPNANMTLLALDLGSLSSVRKCVEAVKSTFPHINILINNAGVMNLAEPVGHTADGFETHIGINHLGHFLWTNLLLDHVKKAGAGSRIVFTGSSVFFQAELDLDDLHLERKGQFGFGGGGAYANSKLANMYMTHSLAKMLRDEGTGIATYVLCPGNVVTEVGRDLPGFKRIMFNLIKKLLAITPEEGVTTILYCALARAARSESGLMYRYNGVWDGAMEKAIDDDVADALWRKSEQLVGLGK